MRIVRAATEAEMVASFLVAELRSPRFGPAIAQILASRGQPTSLLTEPVLSDPRENEQRRQVLSEFRGYRQNRELFTGFPDQLDWQHVVLSPAELMDVLYIDYSYWTELTGGTRRPTDAARFISDGGLVFGHLSTAQFLAVAAALRNGLRWEPIICVRAGDRHPIVVLEGHTRLTAMALALDCLPDKVPVLLGTSSALVDWSCY